MRFCILAVLLCLSAPFALADSLAPSSYLGTDNLIVYGITDAGTAVVGRSCGQSLFCYYGYDGSGQMTFSTPDYPSGLTLDNGQACDPPAGIRSGEPGKCNNGFQIYGVGYEVYEIVPGGEPLGTLVYRGTDDVVYLNQFGGFVAIDGDNDNTFVQANIATSPEPASWFLLATGMLAGGMALRRHARTASA